MYCSNPKLERKCDGPCVTRVSGTYVQFLKCSHLKEGDQPVPGIIVQVVQ